MLTPAQERFAERVAAGTGLEIPTVRAWVHAEGGPDDNPLNIMQWDRAGNRSIRRFGTPDAAAQATVRLLNTSRYSSVLRVAREPGHTARDELLAIAQSPWEENNYRGKSNTVGALLLGAYRTVSADLGTTDVKFGGGFAPDDFTPGFDLPGLPDPGAWVDRFTGWVEGSVAKAFLHLAFTGVAFMLIAVGVLRTFGTSPLELAGVAASRRPRSPLDKAEGIPF